MQQLTIQVGQAVQPSILSKLESVVNNCKLWLNAKSVTFSSLCQEDFTHKEVIIAHAAFALLIVACGIAELIEKGGAL